ncbi:MAG: hypothetical protein HYY04_11500 [Chloroflexi bacterium]|nr:hypothetical protein [Chloroflexota bacterium]
MDALICWLQDVADGDADLAGGKGANLGRLLRMGLPVPPGFVVTTAAYRAFLAANDLTDATPEVLRARIPDAPIPAAISAAILHAHRQLPRLADGVSHSGPSSHSTGAAPLNPRAEAAHLPSAVAIRSSGTAEDLATASFAGQHDTFLNVAGPEAVLTAIRACWASLWSPRAIAYRRGRGWDERGLALAVVVQAMVPAEWAGVLFTANPVTGQRDQVIVEAISGLGEALVSGQVGGKRHVIDKASRRVLTEDPLLPRPTLDELVRLGVQIEEGFGQPQDIEWAWVGGRCYVLQSRPLTALPAEVAPAAPTAPEKPRRYNRFQRANAPNMLDHIPLPPYPFDYSLFFRPALLRVFQSLRSLGFSPPALEDIFVEVADGVVQVVPPAFRPTLGALVLPARLVAALRVRPDGWLEECRGTLVALAHRIDAEDLSILSDEHLLDRIEMLRTLQVELFASRFGRFPRGLLVTQGLSLLLRLAVGAQAPKVTTDLLAGVPCNTTEMNRELGRLARLIRGSADLRLAFLEETPERIPHRLSDSATGRAFLAEMEAFLGCYGYRETTMPAAALPAWRDDPSIVYGMLKGLTAGGWNASALDSDGERAERAKQEVVAALSGGWFGVRRRLLLPLFLKALAVARDFIAFRENSHFYLFMPFPVVRRLALELGRRLVARGVIDEAGDVFFLKVEEIREPGPAAAVREKVLRRKRARRSVEGRIPTVPAALLARPTSHSEVRGVPVSPGQVVGRVRHIPSERDFGNLQKGEVLVARYTNPAWTPLFAIAGAVVVDAGGAASHTAIVAREYGIPAVMGTGNATSRLREGQRVLVDGGNGRVVPIE